MEQQEAKARAEAREEAEIREYRRGLEFKVGRMHMPDPLESGRVHLRHEETARAFFHVSGCERLPHVGLRSCRQPKRQLHCSH